MGMFDTVLITCPTCSYEIDSQSKSDGCCLNTFTFEEAPANVLAGIFRETCPRCGETVQVVCVTKPVFKLVKVRDIE